MSTEVKFSSFLSAERESLHPAEPNRYVLYLHYGCPWSQRVYIVLHLKGGDKLIATAVLDPRKTEEGFQFTGVLDTDAADPIYGAIFSSHVMGQAEGDDRKQESEDLIRMLYPKFDNLLPQGYEEMDDLGGELYRLTLRSEIDKMNGWIQEAINTGVYKCGDAKTQTDYDASIGLLFTALDRLELHLKVAGHGPFLFGNTITETDIRLFTTLIRFDVSYFTIMKCSKRMIRYNYPNLHDWLRRLYWDNSPATNKSAFRRTTKFDHIQLFYSSWVPHHIQVASPEPPIMTLE